MVHKLEIFIKKLNLKILIRVLILDNIIHTLKKCKVKISTEDLNIYNQVKLTQKISDCNLAFVVVISYYSQIQIYLDTFKPFF